MRLFSILAAIIVSLAIYLFVFERPRLTALLPASSAPEEAAQTDQSEPSAPDPGGAINVVAQRSTAQDIGSAVVLRGRTQAMRQVEVRAETSGKVVSEPLRKGSFVETGQTLCRLAPGTREATLAEARARRAEAETRVPEAQARLAEAEARLAEAQLNDTAAERLSESGFASDTRVAGTRAALSAGKAAVQAARSGLDAARTGIEAASANIAAAEEELARLDITAPFAGLLESDTAELGELLQPGALCAVVIQLDPVKLVGFAPEADVALITAGAEARARLIGDAEVSGKVTFISRAADPETRTFRVEVTVPNPDLALRDGQTAEITVAAAGTPAHLIPQSALTLSDEGTLGVRIVTQANEADFVPVTLIRDTPSGIWVSGLPEVADVIVIGQEYVVAGVPVKASFADPAQ
ncbi:efflux RND transporter periplasmic adaptor subunit [Pelagivirga sediminicola]|uniref:Efflux RND transporter periplasmic adaptor subunit n=1 Tax=Pelagivirga sediminicola TaxID=2170575 RepID=A0A2T7GAC3_9RHOB|nr:efflux RND transporter periplasmic adaptor subunit [Pelagivirga sediminicola]PVA11359.1 efflux RND transporter periplasmic adaptor subunit [Pelagivirga sediminicola]